MTNINFRVDENVKKQATELFEQLGLDMSTALNMFLHQAILEKGMPFIPTLVDMKNAGIPVINNQNDLNKVIATAEQDIANGNLTPADIVRQRIKNKYGI